MANGLVDRTSISGFLPLHLFHFPDEVIPGTLLHSHFSNLLLQNASQWQCFAGKHLHKKFTTLFPWRQVYNLLFPWPLYDLLLTSQKQGKVLTASINFSSSIRKSNCTVIKSTTVRDYRNRTAIQRMN